MTALWLACTAAYPIDPASASTAFLHYRWHQDGSMTLVSQRRVAVTLKPSRSIGRAGKPARPALGGGPIALSYAVVSLRGDTLYEATLPDPRIRRVEFAEPGKPGLRSHAVQSDSGDIFLRIAEPEAKSLRFFQWRRLAPSASLAKAAGEAVEVVKTPLAEFDLP